MNWKKCKWCDMSIEDKEENEICGLCSGELYEDKKK